MDRRTVKEIRENEKDVHGDRRQIKVMKRCDNRSYKEVLMGPMSCTVEDGRSSSVRLLEHFESYQSLEKNSEKIVNGPTVNFELRIPNSDMEWLEGCVMGRLRDNFEVRMVNQSLEEAEYYCQVCRLGGLSIVLKFDSNENRDSFLNGDKGMKEQFFEVIQPWSKDFQSREYAIWVQLEEVPLHLWHENIFSSLGNRWGTFVRLDDCTKNKSRFDIARMLVLVDTRFKIPPFVTVRFKGQDNKILVSMDEYNDLETDESEVKEKCGFKYMETELDAAVMNRNNLGSSEGSGLQKMKRQREREETLLGGDFDPGAKSDRGNVAEERGSRLSLEEMIGAQAVSNDCRLIYVAEASDLMMDAAGKSALANSDYM
ncbi:hypothetical protein DITRI_Ditri07aG0055300 [Diplodiscus trichospermus]